MTLEQLQALSALARGGSFAEAARATGVPRTSLARRLEALEEALGVSLVRRGAAGVELTPSGERLATRAVQVLREVEELSAAVRDEAELAGTLRIGCPIGLHPQLLLAAARTLQACLPRVTVRVVPGATRPEEVDVGFWIGERPPDGALLARALARFPVRLLAGSAYRRARGAPTTLEALVDHEVWAFCPVGPFPGLPLASGGVWPLAPKVLTADLHFLHCAARDGLALVWAVDGGIAEAPGVERLEPVLPELTAGSVSVWVLLPEVDRVPPRIREAVRVLQGMMGAVTTAGP